jgi:flagellar biosynthetic protein FliQ
MVVAPILLVATVVSLTVNVIQVLTSIQEMTIATVPRLLATAAALLLLMPWMLRRLAQFTLQILSNFRPYLG